MTHKSMELIISKYINEEATEAEMNELVLWLEDEKNNKAFKDYLTINHSLNQDLVFDALKAYNKTLKTNMPPKKVKPLFTKSAFKYAVAASIVLLISLPFIFNGKDDVHGDKPTIVNNSIQIGTDKATLTLEDGSTIALEKGKQYITDNLESTGEDLVYSKPKEAKAEIAYNYLTIPTGGQYHVILSDETEVWLNSESQLKYPVAFTDGETRKVELVYGEAYFDVSPSTNHNGSKFKVLTDVQEVEVLGTEFNISAYQNENVIYTTLVEGKVAISNGEASTILSPEQQAIVKDNQSGIQVVSADVYNTTSWRKGIFSFDNMPLEKIMTVLTRWYDVNVVFDDIELKNVNFNGVLRKNQNIEEILMAIKNINNINYEINDNTVNFK